MEDFEDIISAKSEEDLQEIKEALINERLHIQMEKKRLLEEDKRLRNLQDDFLKNRERLRDEIDELNRRTLSERTKLKQENLFFEKKMAILQEGFKALEEDRKAFEEEKSNYIIASTPQTSLNDAEAVAAMMFRSVTNSLGLRKRYKDLMKIYHPDNVFGDGELVTAIGKEYTRLKEKAD